MTQVFCWLVGYDENLANGFDPFEVLLEFIPKDVVQPTVRSLLHYARLYIKSFDKERKFGSKRNLWCLGLTVYSWHKVTIN